MATGTLNSAIAPGTITVVTDPSGQLNPGDLIDFDTLPPDCKVDMTVTFDIDNSGRTPLAINITPDSAPPVDPDFPYNNQFPGATIINTPQTKDLIINGTTTIVEGVTLTGNVKVSNGGTFIVKSVTPTSTIEAVITGHINADENTTVIIYNSTIGSNVSVEGAASLRVVKGTGVKGHMEIAKTQNVTVKGTGVKGNMEIARAQNVTVKGTGVKGNMEIHGGTGSTVITDVVSSNGNIEIQGNAGCSYKNITAPHGKVNISGCTPA